MYVNIKTSRKYLQYIPTKDPLPLRKACNPRLFQALWDQYRDTPTFFPSFFPLPAPGNPKALLCPPP